MADTYNILDENSEILDKNFKVQSVYNLMTKTNQEIVDEIGMQKNNELSPDDEEINRVTLNTRKTFTKRFFSPLEDGSLRGSIFAMSSLALGTGCLALPRNFLTMSFTLALVMLLIGAAAAYWSLIIMIEASKKTKSTEYSKLVKDTLGRKMAMFLDIMILIYIFGILISYQVIIYQLIGSFIYEVAYTDDYTTVTDFNKELWYTAIFKFPIMYAICLILIPLCLLKDISKMRIASLFSIASLLYAIFVIIIECPMYYSDFMANKYDPNDPKKQVNWFDISVGFDEHLYFFRGTATVFFAFTCHVGAFPVFKTLKNNVSRRINKVFQRSILLDVVIYIFVGICGYLTQPINTPGLIINRDKLLTNDVAMIIARLLIAFNLVLSTPANYNAFRLSLLEIVYGDSEVTNKR